MTEIPPPNPEVRQRATRQTRRRLARVSPVAREMYWASVEWSLAAGTNGRVPKSMVDSLHAVAVARCRDRGETTP